MKRFLMALFTFCIIFLTTYSCADTNVKEFKVSDFEINKIVEGRFFGNFNIENLGERYYNELYYMIYLVPKDIYDKNTNMNLSANNYISDPFTLCAKENKLIAFEFDVPIQKLPYDEYVLVLKVANEAVDIVKPIAIYGVFVGNEELAGYIKPVSNEKTHYYKIKNFNEPLSGPYRDIGDPATVYINIKSTFDKTIKVKPRIRFYKRNQSFSQETYQQFGKEVTLKANESKEVAVSLPDIKIPESYYYIIQFVDENNNEVSYEYNLRCVINGETAKISEINTLYDSSKEVLKIFVYYIGSSDGKVIENVEFTNGVYETESGKIIENYIDKFDLQPSSFVVSYSVKLPSDDTQVTIHSSIKKADAILAFKKLDLPVEATAKSIEKFSDIKNTKYEKPVKILNSYKIVSGYPDGTFKPGKTLTRAELTSIALNMLKVDLGSFEVENNAFSDVPENHWAYKAINYAYQNGIINGYGNGLFKPNNEVKYSEAIAILINTAGYKFIAENNGEAWPNNYILAAKDIGIDVGTNIEDFLSFANRGEISILTLNSYIIRED